MLPMMYYKTNDMILMNKPLTEFFPKCSKKSAIYCDKNTSIIINNHFNLIRINLSFASN